MITLHSLETAVVHNSGSVTGMSYVPVPSCSSSDNIQISPNAPPLADAPFRLRCFFKLDTFKVQTLLRIGQRGRLARTLDILAIDMSFVHETRIQDSNSVIRLISSSSPSKKFNLHLSGDSKAAAFGVADVDVALGEKAEAAPLAWIQVDSWLCAVRFGGSCGVNNRRSGRRNLLLVSACAPTDRSPNAVKGTFYQKLQDSLRTARQGEIVILAGYMNAPVGRLFSNGAQLGGPFGLDFCRSEDGGRLWPFNSDHQLFLISTSFRRPKRR